MKCPHCQNELTPEQVKKLWSQLGAGTMTEKRSNAARENGKKGGRPKKVKALEEGWTKGCPKPGKRYYVQYKDGFEDYAEYRKGRPGEPQPDSIGWRCDKNGGWATPVAYRELREIISEEKFRGLIAKISEKGKS